MATDFLTELKNEELAIVAGPLEDFLVSLQSPDVNYLSVLHAAKNLQLKVLMLDGPAQSVFINLIASSLQAKLKSILTPATATPAA